MALTGKAQGLPKKRCLKERAVGDSVAHSVLPFPVVWQLLSIPQHFEGQGGKVSQPEDENSRDKHKGNPARMFSKERELCGLEESLKHVQTWPGIGAHEARCLQG